MPEKVTKSQEAWRQSLDEESFCVLREHATERAFSGEYCNAGRFSLHRCSPVR